MFQVSRHVIPFVAYSLCKVLNAEALWQNSNQEHLKISIFTVTVHRGMNTWTAVSRGKLTIDQCMARATCTTSMWKQQQLLEHVSCLYARYTHSIDNQKIKSTACIRGCHTIRQAKMVCKATSLHIYGESLMYIAHMSRKHKPSDHSPAIYHSYDYAQGRKSTNTLLGLQLAVRNKHTHLKKKTASRKNM